MVEWLGRRTSQVQSRSDHYLELFFGGPGFKSSASFVNIQMVHLLPAGILNHVMLYLKYLFLPVCFIVPEKPLSGEDS